MPGHAKSGQVIREGLQVPIMSIIQQYIRPSDRPSDRQTWSGIELLRAAKKHKLGRVLFLLSDFCNNEQKHIFNTLNILNTLITLI